MFRRASTAEAIQLIVTHAARRTNTENSRTFRVPAIRNAYKGLMQCTAGIYYLGVHGGGPWTSFGV